MIGSLLLKLKQKYKYGLRAAWYRDQVRPKILQTQPVTGTTDYICEIHVLTCKEDWLNLLWMLKSFYFYSGVNYSLCIHEDGSLSADHINILQSHFPNARVVTKGYADLEINKLLKKFPQSVEFRLTNPLSLKVFDFFKFLNSKRMLLLDSDILFFRKPEELLLRIESQEYLLNSLNKDWAYGYSINFDSIKDKFLFKPVSHINSGLGLIHKDSIDLEAIEQFLSIPGIFSHSHRIEQTLIALYSSKFGFEFLPKEYDVHLGPLESGLACRHFTGPVRHLMYRDGIRFLLKTDFLDVLSRY